MEYYGKLVLVWGGSAAVEPLNYGINSSCVNEYSANEDNIVDERNTSTSSSSSNNSDIADGEDSREDSQFKRDLAEAIRQSNELFAQSTKELSQSMLAMASGITKSVEILSQALSNQNQQAS